MTPKRPFRFSQKFIHIGGDGLPLSGMIYILFGILDGVFGIYDVFLLIQDIQNLIDIQCFQMFQHFISSTLLKAKQLDQILKSKD